MIFVINPGLFNYTMKMVNPFNKIQLHSINDNKRVCTIMTDAIAGEEIDKNYVNIKTRSGKVSTSGETEVLVRSCSTNKYDGNFIIAAIPFNGVVLPTYLSNFRFRYAEVVDIEGEITLTDEANYPEGLRYIEAMDMIDTPEKILYCIIEPNTGVMFDESHAKHTKNIYVNIPFAALDQETDKVTSNTNFRITINVVGLPKLNEGGNKFGRGALTLAASYAPRRMVPKVMGQLNKDIHFQLEATSLPYPIYFVPEKKNEKPQTKNTKHQKPQNSNNDWMESGEKQNKYAGLNKRNKKQQQATGKKKKHK